MRDKADIFKVLGEPIRLRILRLLLKVGKEICVCELVDALMVPQYAISRNLKELEGEGLVESKREGKWVYYFPAKNKDGFKRHLFQTLLQLSDPVFLADENNLKERFEIRVKGKCVLGIQSQKLMNQRSLK